MPLDPAVWYGLYLIMDEEIAVIVFTISRVAKQSGVGILTNALVAVPGVIGAKVSYGDRSAVVRFGSDAVLDIGTIEIVVQKPGYRILSMDDHIRR